MLSEYQQQLRDRFLAAPVMPAPDPWRPVTAGLIPVGGLVGVGFGLDPDWPTGPALTCPGLGPLAGTDVRIAGPAGGGLHTSTEDEQLAAALRAEKQKVTELHGKLDALASVTANLYNENLALRRKLDNQARVVSLDAPSPSRGTVTRS